MLASLSTLDWGCCPGVMQGFGGVRCTEFGLCTMQRGVQTAATTWPRSPNAGTNKQALKPPLSYYLPFDPIHDYDMAEPAPKDSEEIEQFSDAFLERSAMYSCPQENVTGFEHGISFDFQVYDFDED